MENPNEGLIVFITCLASEVPVFFSGKIMNSVTKGRKRYNFEMVEDRSLKFRLLVRHT